MVSVQAPVNLTLMYHRSCFIVGLGISGHRYFSGYRSGAIVAGSGWVLTGGHLKSFFSSLTLILYLRSGEEGSAFGEGGGGLCEVHHCSPWKHGFC